MKTPRLSGEAIAAAAGIPGPTLRSWIGRRILKRPNRWRPEDAVSIHILWHLTNHGWSLENALTFVETNRHIIERGSGWLVIGRAGSWGLGGGGHFTCGGLLVDRPEDLERAVLHAARVKADCRSLLVFDLSEISAKCKVGLQAYLGSLRMRGRRPKQLTEMREG